MEKHEYGTDEFYWIEFEIGKSYALNDLNNAGVDYINSTHHAETCDTTNILVRNKEGIFKQSSMAFFKEDANRTPIYTVVNCGAWLSDGSSLNFESLVFSNGSGFVHLHHRHCINGKEQYFKSFTNSEIMHMQENAPDHPLVQMLNKVAVTLEGKDSAEKASEMPEGAAPANR